MTTESLVTYALPRGETIIACRITEALKLGEARRARITLRDGRATILQWGCQRHSLHWWEKYGEARVLDAYWIKGPKWPSEKLDFLRVLEEAPKHEQPRERTFRDLYGAMALGLTDAFFTTALEWATLPDWNVTHDVGNPAHVFTMNKFHAMRARIWNAGMKWYRYPWRKQHFRRLRADLRADLTRIRYAWKLLTNPIPMRPRELTPRERSEWVDATIRSRHLDNKNVREQRELAEGVYRSLLQTARNPVSLFQNPGTVFQDAGKF